MRDEHIDFYRGIAFINMAIFHLLFNLKNFNLIELNVFTNEYAIIWRGYIVSSYLLFVGISLVLVKRKYTDRSIFSFSLRQLFLASLLVSFATYIVFPQQWIYFGILHFIFFAKIISSFFVNKAFLSLLISISIFITFYFIGSWNPFMYYYGKGILPSITLDMVNILPWLGVVFLGIFLGHYPLYKYLPVFNIKPIMWLGKHSLSMYLFHQAMLFPLVFAIYWLKSNLF